MRSTRIYTEEDLRVGVTISLGEQASHHLSRVLRCQAGDPLTLFNGGGGEYQANVSEVTKTGVSVTVGEFRNVCRESVLELHLGLGISRPERMDWAIQKATELGVTRITPLNCARVQGVGKPAQLAKRLCHWRAIAVSASEQSGRTAVPIVASPTDLREWLEHTQADLKFVLHPGIKASSLPSQAVSSVALMCGAEGGFTEQEIEGAQQQGFGGLNLGPRILRTETAPLAAISLCQSWWGDFPSPDQLA